MSWRFFGGGGSSSSSSGSERKAKAERKKTETNQVDAAKVAAAASATVILPFVPSLSPLSLPLPPPSSVSSTTPPPPHPPSSSLSLPLPLCDQTKAATTESDEFDVDSKKPATDSKKEEGAEKEDDTYDVLTSIEKTSLENRKMLALLVKRNKVLEQRLDEYDKLFSRLTEYLDVQQMQDVRQHNRLLRLGMPVPFRSTQTDRVGMDRVPSHSADRWQSVAQGPMIHRHAIFSHHNGQPMCNIGVHRDI